MAAARAALKDSRSPIEALEISLPDASPTGRVRALAWLADPTRAPSAVHIVSPGALVPAASMATFARTLARRLGSLVLVVDYDWAVFRENPAEQAKAYTLARAFLPRAEVEIFGHSAGGAVLAPATDDPPEGLRRVALHGVSRLFVSPTAPRVPVRLLAGSRDGLVTDEGLAALGGLFSTAPERLPGVNHFCIIDGDAGSPETRALDGKTAFDTAQCAERVIDAWFAPDARVQCINGACGIPRAL